MEPSRCERSRSWRRASGVVIGVALAYVGSSLDLRRCEVVPSGGTFGPSLARADYPEGHDTDADGLSDEFERFSKTDSFDFDCDDDGYSDGAEWVLRSDPVDPASTPEVAPAVRSYAYESAGVLRVYTAFYPANVDLIDSFHVVAGSPNFVAAVEGDPGSGLGVIDLTSLIPTIATGFCASDFLGLDLVSFHFDVDLSVMRTAAPICLGFATKLAGIEAIDQLFLSSQGATSFVVAGGPALPSGLLSFAVQPLQPIPPPDDETPEYCSVAFSEGAPVGVATLEFVVNSADCEPDGLLYCIDADCTALDSQTFLMLDYGYLQSKANQ